MTGKQGLGHAYIATGKKGSHACLAEGGGEYAALKGLAMSIRNLESSWRLTTGQTVELRDSIGDAPSGQYVIADMDDDGLTLVSVGEDPETGEPNGAEYAYRIPIAEIEKLSRAWWNEE